MLRGLNYERQKNISINYKGLFLDAALRYDILIENLIVVVLKAVDGILPIHEAILLSYMRLLEKPKGVFLNFKCTNILREGQKTLINGYFSALPKK
jgi:GxxExxY protein